jgi:hypothetical protein
MVPLEEGEQRIRLRAIMVGGVTVLGMAIFHELRLLSPASILRVLGG